MAKLLFTGDTGRCTYEVSPFDTQLNWLQNQKIIGLDTETNVVDSILKRELKVMSIADEQGDVVWVIHWMYLNPLQKTKLLQALRTKLCIIQNVPFDYTILKKEGCILENVHDTMLAEQILTTGLSSEQGYHGLQAIYQRRFGLIISKDEQLSFGGYTPLSNDQIKYAAVDVLKLGTLRKLQRAEMRYEDKRIGQKRNKGLLKTLWWENEFAKVVGDMETTGIRLDKDKWYAIEDAVKPIYDKELAIINDIVKRDFWDILVDNEWISDEDKFTTPIWTSAAKKKIILEATFNFEIEKTAQTELKKLLMLHDPDFPLDQKLSGKNWTNSDYPTRFTNKFAIIKLLIMYSTNKEKVAEHLDKFLMDNHKQLCIDQGWLRPAGVLELNWNSYPQKLKIFRAINQSIESTGSDVIEEYISEHELFPHYLEWAGVAHQLKSFGKKFYDEHVDLDGKHRTRYKQILSTGRLSSVKPNILNIPRKKDAYRKAIIPDPGYDFVNSDFDGQELVITAYISGEPSWLQALKNGWDLHSRNADLVYGDEWYNAKEANCEYYQLEGTTEKVMYKKCSCPRHQELRDNVKMVGFGMIYGITEFSLGPRLNLTTEKARDLMIKFFEACPKVEIMMQKFGSFAINNGYIIDPVFGRVRYFDKWKLYKEEYTNGIKRQAMNFPIQSAGADLLKIALVLLRRKLTQEQLNDVIQILMPYHDEASVQAKPLISKKAGSYLENSMRRAAQLSGYPLLGASAAIGDSWYSAH